MAKEINPELAAFATPNPDQEAAIRAFVYGQVVRPFDPEAVITQLLDNVIGHLDEQRRLARNAGRADMNEVRLFGTMAHTLLSGYDEDLGYDQLVAVIDKMKAGQARRRVALESA